MAAARNISSLPFLVFDLDGTLIDGYDAIGEALAYAMGKFGLEALPPEQVRVMVGQGIEKLLEKAVGRDTAAEGVRLFRERYPQVAVSGSRLLPDVAAVLAALGGRGYRMAVASNKPARFSRMILDACGVGAFFTAVGGPDEHTPTKPDPEMLNRLMAAQGASPAETIVIGDMEVDSEFARAAGCRVVLVPSGSRTREELRTVDADALLDSLSDLPLWLEGKS
ncbi:MAG TPA: HAD-IA family hydrolase [Thermoanaerobaculia bacterium]|nr:HAD-IA family hydrolase [Thermoanaerobaculia bacterium]